MNKACFYQITYAKRPQEPSFGLFAGFATIEQLGENKNNDLDYILKTFLKLCVAYGHLNDVVPICIVASNFQVETVRKYFSTLKKRFSLLHELDSALNISLENIYYLFATSTQEGVKFDFDKTKSLNDDHYNTSFFDQIPHIISNHLTQRYHLGLLQQWSDYTETHIKPDESSDQSQTRALKFLANKSHYYNSLYREKGSPLHKVDTAFINKEHLLTLPDFPSLKHWFQKNAPSDLSPPIDSYYLKPTIGAGGKEIHCLDRHCKPSALDYESNEYLLQPNITQCESNLLDSISINFCLHKNGPIEIVNATVQLYSDSQCTQHIGSFYDPKLSNTLIEEVGFEKLKTHAELLAKLGVLGPFGMDFVKNKHSGRYADIIDCNLRLTASAPVCLLATSLNKHSGQIKKMALIGNSGAVKTDDIKSTITRLEKINLLYSKRNPRGILLVPNMSGHTSYDPLLINIEVNEMNEILQSLQLCAACDIKKIYYHGC